MKVHGVRVLFAVATSAVLAGGASRAEASVTITGVADPQYLISGSAPKLASEAVLKLVFENKTVGTNVQLCAGAIEDFAQGKCTIALSGSGGPGFAFVTLVDARELSGKVLYAIRAVGTAPSQFTLTIE